MKLLIKMAWRNIWRSRKRTILTLLSIFMAVFLSLFTRSMQIGSYGMMIGNAVKFSTGYIQIHQNGYWENKSINESMFISDSIMKQISLNSNVSLLIPRLESFALASKGDHTKGTLVVGTDVKLEDELNNYSSKIISGEYLQQNDNQILVAEKLADYLNVSVGDSLVLLGQGFHGLTAAAQFKVKGIIRFPIPILNNQLVILPLNESQYFYGVDNRVTSISLMLNDPELIDRTIEELEFSINKSKDYEIMSWEELNPEIVQAIQSDNIGGIIMLGILYLVIGFGLFGTIMMMTMERRKEFAVMISIGLQKTKLLLVVLWETIFIGIIAVILGIIFSYPVLLYLYHNPIPLTGELADSMLTFGVEPILPFSIKTGIFVNQTLIVIGIAIIAVLYPLSVILKFNILKAMRS